MSKAQKIEMSFMDHLEELRWHIIRAIVAVLIAATVAFIAKDFLFEVIIFGPKHMDFLTYRWLCSFAQRLQIESSFCADELPFKIQNRKVAGQFTMHIWTSIYAGIILAFPYVLYQFWSFVSPGLHKSEKRYSRGIIFFCSLLFFLGVLFSYYVIIPFSLNFLSNYTISEEISNEIDINSYISLIRSSSLATGFIFELPIIVFFLTKIGLVTPKILKKYRKYALVMVLVLAAIITPPDVVSQVIVAIPILILYQISIYISSIVLKSNNKEK